MQNRSIMYHWFSFKGRMTRKEYWLKYFVPVVVLFVVVMLVVMGLAMLMTDPATGLPFDTFHVIATPIVVLLYALVAWMGLAASVKRLHDIDRSGWWVLLVFVPLAGLLIFVWNGFFKGTEGPNQFGADPNNPGASAQQVFG